MTEPNRRTFLKRTAATTLGTGVALEGFIGTATANENLSVEGDGTQSVSKNGYNKLDRDSVTVGDCRGKFTHTTTLYVHNTHGNRFVVTDTLHVVPGDNIDECNSNASSVVNGGLSQNWSDGYAPVTVEKEQPTGKRDGTFSRTYSLGYQEASVSYTYTQPDISMHTSSDTNDARWRWGFENSPYTTVSLTTGSRAHFTRDGGPGDRALDSHAEFLFQSGNGPVFRNTNYVGFGNGNIH
jgi:hypothetical protein